VRRFAQALLFAALALAGCKGGRFATCETDDDCKNDDGKPYCVDLRCVECFYDRHCKGGACNSKTQTCASLD
jgi:hypothetical protein